MINTALVEGLEIVALVSVMTLVMSPILCWILPDRSATLGNGAS